MRGTMDNTETEPEFSTIPLHRPPRSFAIPLAMIWLIAWPLMLCESFAADTRPRLIVETDAGGDPDDEQSLVRFLVYANEFDIEGIIANRPVARNGENKNPIRDGLGIVRALIHAYGQSYPNLMKHDSRSWTTRCSLSIEYQSPPEGRGYHDVSLSGPDWHE